MSEAIEEKAAEYLVSGKVQAVEVTDTTAIIFVYGSASAPYSVHFNNAVWYCGCPSRKPECAHVVAAKLICPLRAETSTPKIGSTTLAELDALLGDN